MGVQIISSSEFRNNQRYYLDKAKEEGVVYISQRNEGIFSLRPTSEIEFYYSNPMVQEDLKQALSEVKEGKTHTMKEGENLEQFLTRMTEEGNV
ncbi:hypothetical protein [Porphyromonas levii]|uniref:hypothetical protein n=1 Tax=Porphyromonas levii TaxID=28114 RepID=UPI001B8C8E62|nr:hypothetical protein [Porphyromonas levii]